MHLFYSNADLKGDQDRTRKTEVVTEQAVAVPVNVEICMFSAMGGRI